MNKITIEIKESSLLKILKAVENINNHGGLFDNDKASVEKLIDLFANSLDVYDTNDILMTKSWNTKAVPIILNSDAFKHYVEFKKYVPDAMNIITDFIHKKTTSERIAKIITSNK